MPVQNTSSFIAVSTYKEMPFGTVLIISIALHVVALLAIPLISTLIWKPAKFERPQTFQLVKMPSPAQLRKLNVSQKAPKQQISRKEKLPEPKPVPSKQPALKQADKKPTPQKEAAQPVEENLEELESLLDELPSPVQASAVGTFKYPWYINNIIQKVERNWTPSTENRKISVRISFVIDRDGNASHIKVIESSGNSSLDNLAIRAVTLASPFGRMPPAFAEDQIELNMTLYPYRN